MHHKCRSRCITTTSTNLATTRCRIISTIFKSSTSQAQVAAGLGTTALGQLGTAASTFGGVGTGAQSFQQGVSQDFMSPYQSQVIDASLAEFDRNKQIQEQRYEINKQSLGALGSGRAGVQLAEFGTGAARERALLQAGLLQQGFGQAQAARQQDIQNRFNLGQAQQGIAGATQGLGAFPIRISWSTSCTWTANNKHTRNRYFTFRFIGRTEPSANTSRT